MDSLDRPGIKEAITKAANILIEAYEEGDGEPVVFDLSEDHAAYATLKAVINNHNVIEFINQVLDEKDLIMGQHCENPLEIIIMSKGEFDKDAKLVMTKDEYKQIVESLGEEEAKKILDAKSEMALDGIRVN